MQISQSLKEKFYYKRQPKNYVVEAKIYLEKTNIETESLGAEEMHVVSMCLFLEGHYPPFFRGFSALKHLILIKV